MTDAPARNAKYIKITQMSFKQNVYNVNTSINVQRNAILTAFEDTFITE
jgi:hypothetical protein